VVVLVGGALLCLALMALDVPGGLGGLLELGGRAGKLHTFDFSFDFTATTFWVVVLGGLAASFISYGSDQAVIQRYLTTKDERAAARGIWTNGVLSVAATVLFFSMGTALYAFYRTHPRLLDPTLTEADAIFPWYIVTQLPAGAAGVLIAGVFAAAMSSLDSSMNSVATAVTTDFYRRFRPRAADRRCLALARWSTVAVGAAGTAFALTMTGWDIKSLWDEFAKVLGLFSGGLGGLFLLGILTRRAHGRGAVVGLLLSGAAPFLVQRYTPASFLLYGACGLLASVVLGYAASLLIPAPRRPLEGLTFYTLNRET
jgi:Na+/proline symporter